MKPSPLISVLLLGALLFCAAPAPAQAATPPTWIMDVNTTADTSDADLNDGLCKDAGNLCSLRAAVQQSNKLSESGSADFIINLQRDTTYTLTQDFSLTVTANQVRIQTVSGSGAAAVISHPTKTRSFVVDSGGVLTLYDLTVANGGGLGINTSSAILHLDTATLTNLSFQFTNVNPGTQPSPSAGGGAIYNYQGLLTMDNCTVTNNTTNGNGGAIFNRLGRYDIQNSTFTGNSAWNGGAIYSLSDSNSVELKHISNSVFEGNSAIANEFGGGYGGAFYLDGHNVQNIDGTSSVYINQTRIHNNQAAHGGGIYVGRRMENPNIGFTDLGGMNLVNSEVSANIALSGNGGGIYINNASTTSAINIENSTLTGNEAFLHGGGLYILADPNNTTSIYNSTITDNAADRLRNQDGNGGGYYNASQSTLFLKNSILAGNRDLTNIGLIPTRVRDCVGTLELYYSLLGNKYLSFCTIAPTSSGHIFGNNSFIDPLLGALTSGTTTARFHPLLEASPAIDSADPGGCYGYGLSRLLITDQNGDPRPQGPACDMGAKEAAYTPPVVIDIQIYLPSVMR